MKTNKSKETGIEWTPEERKLALWSQEWAELADIAKATESVSWQNLMARIARGELVVMEAKAEPKGQWVVCQTGDELRWLDHDLKWTSQSDRVKLFDSFHVAKNAHNLRGGAIWKVS